MALGRLLAMSGTLALLLVGAAVIESARILAGFQALRALLQSIAR
jgi:hypothetical protein